MVRIRVAPVPSDKSLMNAVPLDLNASAHHFRALTLALAARDTSTNDHSLRTHLLSQALGRDCGLSLPSLGVLHTAALMHDIGKLAIPDRVLLKPGAFNDEERLAMQGHAEQGANILLGLNLEGMDMVAEAVRHHHEGFDGHGYPAKLAGESIPLLARIIAVADTYDATTTPRPYHPGRNHADAMRLIHDQAGAKFDPYLVNKFARLIEGSDYRVA